MAFLPTASTITVGGYVFTDLTNLIVLMAQVTTLGGTVTTFRTVSGSSGYTPSGANKFRMYAFRAQSVNATSNQIRFEQTDNDAGLNGVTATNPVYITGNSNLYYPVNYTTASQQGIGEVGLGKGGFLVANAKYLTCEVNSAAGVVCTVYGYEEA